MYIKNAMYALVYYAVLFIIMIGWAHQEPKHLGSIVHCAHLYTLISYN